MPKFSDRRPSCLRLASSMSFLSFSRPKRGENFTIPPSSSLLVPTSPTGHDAFDLPPVVSAPHLSSFPAHFAHLSLDAPASLTVHLSCARLITLSIRYHLQCIDYRNRQLSIGDRQLSYLIWAYPPSALNSITGLLGAHENSGFSPDYRFLFIHFLRIID